MTEPSTYSLAILAGLQHKRPGEVYAGTVPEHVKARRRARNKVARASRRGQSLVVSGVDAARRRARHRTAVGRRASTAMGAAA